ncbi:MAG: MFS transporter [Deltaproteobacteria bacterium]|nr:MFS transporter [Deltaproteobacteria bacterium]
MNFRRTFLTVIKYRNYRLWFFGQLVSLFGSWMQMTAQGFLIFELTRSPAYLGYVSFASGLPAWIFVLYGGVIADRMARRSLLLITQTCMMFLGAALAGVTFSGHVQPWQIIVLAFCLGIANAFDAPARQAFVLELVEREDLTNAIALNSTLFNCAAMVGPAAAGLVYAWIGPAWCFVFNSVSFAGIIVALLLIRVKAKPAPSPGPSALAALVEGLRYTASDGIIRSMIGIVAATCLFGFSFTTLLPAWAVHVLDGDAATNGLLHSARGCGALISALLIASLGRFPLKGRLLMAGMFLFPVVLLLFALERETWLALVFMAGVGITLLLTLNLANVLLQTHVEDHVRGRVMSIVSLTHFGLMPIGGLLAGLAASAIGEPATVMASSVIASACALAIWIYAPQVRKLA